MDIIITSDNTSAISIPPPLPVHMVPSRVSALSRSVREENLANTQPVQRPSAPSCLVNVPTSPQSAKKFLISSGAAANGNPLMNAMCLGAQNGFFLAAGAAVAALVGSPFNSRGDSVTLKSLSLSDELESELVSLSEDELMVQFFTDYIIPNNNVRGGEIHSS
jgi:hypothetical protein